MQAATGEYGTPVGHLRVPAPERVSMRGILRGDRQWRGEPAHGNTHAGAGREVGGCTSRGLRARCVVRRVVARGP